MGNDVTAVYDTSSWAVIATPASSTLQEGRATALIDGGTKVAFGDGGRIEIFDIASGSSTRFASISGTALEMDWNPSTEELAVGTSTGRLYVFKPLAPTDTLAPLITVSAPDQGLITNQSSIGTFGTVSDDTGISAFTINGTSTALNSGAFSTTVSLVEGDNVLTYTATDVSGKVSTETRTVTRIVDRTGPSVSNINISPTSGRPGTLFGISASIQDAAGISSATAVLKTQSGSVLETMPMTPSGGTGYSADFDSSPYQPGIVILEIQAVDNSAQSNSTIINNAFAIEIVANQPPNLPFAPLPANGAQDVATDTALSWSGGDPENDPVLYDVLLSSNQGDETWYATVFQQQYVHFLRCCRKAPHITGA